MTVCTMIPAPACDEEYHEQGCQCAKGRYLPKLSCRCGANVPHCRECGQPMRNGVLDTRGSGPNMRYWICDPCDRAAQLDEPRRMPQNIAI